MKNAASGSVKPKKKRHIIANSESSSEHDSYFPDFHQYKKVGMQVERKRVLSGSWTTDETRLYMNFLDHYHKKFGCEEKRRKCTIFNRLSKAINTRTPDQCRSHHQKMQLKYGSIDNIVESLRRRLEEEAETEKKGLALRPTATGEVLT